MFLSVLLGCHRFSPQNSLAGFARFLIFHATKQLFRPSLLPRASSHTAIPSPPAGGAPLQIPRPHGGRSHGPRDRPLRGRYFQRIRQTWRIWHPVHLAQGGWGAASIPLPFSNTSQVLLLSPVRRFSSQTRLNYLDVSLGGVFVARCVSIFFNPLWLMIQLLVYGLLANQVQVRRS